MTTRPLFLFALPRSGSTLLQRMLAAHPDVATAGENWLLLALMQMRNPDSMLADFAWRGVPIGMDDLLAAGGADALEQAASYDRAVRDFAMPLYTRAAGGKPFWLDKTPRYSLIASDILRAFPEARAILMWRNPLAVAHSHNRTFAGGRWHLHYSGIDLFAGVKGLLAAQAEFADRLMLIRYEDLVADPAAHLPGILEHVGLAPDARLLERLAGTDIGGRLGDRQGAADVSTASLDGWKAGFANPLRRAWARRYLDWLGEDRLLAMGYSRGELLREMEIAPASSRYMLSDCWRMALGPLWLEAQHRILRRPDPAVHDGGWRTCWR